MAEDPTRRLEAWLHAHGENVAVRTTGRATGGLSQETWFVDVVDLVGEATTPAVLRLPTAASGARAITAQIDALRRVAGTPVPAPRLLWAGSFEDGLDGHPFLVMSRVDGEVPVGWHVLPPGRRDRLAEHAVDVLADLHAVPIADPAGPVAPPHPLMTLDGLARATARLGGVPRPIEAALTWLDRHRPTEARDPVLVHGDYRMGNLVVGHERVRAVLDWELAAPGAREVDVVWCFLPVFEDSEVHEDALVDRYARRAHVDLEAATIAWHRALAFVRLAYYSLSATAAFDRGRSDDLRLAALRLRLPVTLERLAAAMRDPAIRRARGRGRSASAPR